MVGPRSQAGASHADHTASPHPIVAIRPATDDDTAVLLHLAGLDSSVVPAASCCSASSTASCCRCLDHDRQRDCRPVPQRLTSSRCCACGHPLRKQGIGAGPPGAAFPPPRIRRRAHLLRVHPGSDLARPLLVRRRAVSFRPRGLAQQRVPGGTRDPASRAPRAPRRAGRNACRCDARRARRRSPCV